MRTYACDWCFRARKQGERWFLGFAAERIGSTGVQREMSMAATWSDRAADHPLAVHFCSASHRDAYVAALFRSAARPTRDTARRSRSLSAGQSSSTVALGIGACSLDPGPSRPGSTRVTQPRAKLVTDEPPGLARFDYGDGIRSHGLSIRLDEGRESRYPADGTFGDGGCET